MHITTQQIQTAAARQLAALRRRAAEHLDKARTRVGHPQNLTLASLVDDLADDATTTAQFAADLCTAAGDQPGADVILADLFGTHQILTRTGLDCRMAGLQPWPPAVAAAQQVLQ